MSTNNRNQNPSSHSNGNNTVAIVVISIIIAFIAIIVGYQFGIKKGENRSINTNNSNNSALITSNLEEEVSEINNITSHSGIVTNISPDTIQIDSSYNEFGEEINTNISIFTTNNTTYRKIDISKPPIDPDELEEDEVNDSEKTILFSDIQIGDNIVAEAISNIYGKTSFESYEIKVLSNSL